MNPALLAPTMTLGRQAMRSLAVNLPLALSVVIGFAGIHTIAGYRPAKTRNRTFVRHLLRDTTITAEFVAPYLDAKNAIAMAQEALEGEQLDPTQILALRRALAESI